MCIFPFCKVGIWRIRRKAIRKNIPRRRRGDIKNKIKVFAGAFFKKACGGVGAKPTLKKFLTKQDMCCIIVGMNFPADVSGVLHNSEEVNL